MEEVWTLRSILGTGAFLAPLFLSPPPLSPPPLPIYQYGITGDPWRLPVLQRVEAGFGWRLVAGWGTWEGGCLLEQKLLLAHIKVQFSEKNTCSSKCC